MHRKTRKRLRHLARENGRGKLVELPLEFEGERAFVIWDWAVLGRRRFKARIDLDPTLLRKIGGSAGDYAYRGRLVLPRPQDN